MQRYLVRAAIFDFNLVYRKGKLNYLADFAARHPADEQMSDIDRNEEARAKVCSLETTNELSLEKIKLA